LISSSSDGDREKGVRECESARVRECESARVRECESIVSIEGSNVIVEGGINHDKEDHQIKEGKRHFCFVFLYQKLVSVLSRVV
jgi:hypothetical protein